MAFLYADGLQGYATVADMSREYVVTTPAGFSIVTGRSGGWAASERTVIPAGPGESPASNGTRAGLLPTLPARSRTRTWTT